VVPVAVPPAMVVAVISAAVVVPAAAVVVAILPVTVAVLVRTVAVAAVGAVALLLRRGTVVAADDARGAVVRAAIDALGAALARPVDLARGPFGAVVDPRSTDRLPGGDGAVRRAVALPLDAGGALVALPFDARGALVAAI